MSTINEIIESARAEYDAYEPATELTAMTVEAREVRAGDLLNGAKVEATRPGNSKTIVKVDGKKTELRFDFTEKVTVERDVVLDEAKAAQRALREELAALESIVRRAEEPTATKEKLAQALADGYYDRVAELAVSLAASERVRGEFVNAVSAIEKGRCTGVEAKAAIVKSVTDAIVNDQDSPSWSGGFTVANAVNQSIQSARRDVAKSHAWWF